MVEGTGFQSALVRATLTTMTFTLRKMRGWKVVSNADEGLAILVDRTRGGFALDAVDLGAGLRVLGDLRQPAAVTQSYAGGT